MGILTCAAPGCVPTQGVPAGLLREGGETSVKIIETGVATAILERGSLIKCERKREACPLQNWNALDVLISL